MKKGISYWSFEDAIDGSADITTAMQRARDAGFEAIELALSAKGGLTPATDPGGCEAIAASARDIGIEISSLATLMLWDVSPTDDDPAVREEAKGIARAQIERASWLGLDAILYIPGYVHVTFLPDTPVLSYDVVWDRALEALTELAPFAEQHGVKIGVENVGNMFLMSPLEMRDLIDRVGSPNVGAYVDIGNVVYTMGYPEQWLRILGERVVRIHWKDFQRAVATLEGFCRLGEGDVDFPETLKACDEIGYDGYVVAEMAPYASGLLEHTSAAMDRLLRRA
ncbi:MAG: sugar phosphate isomerase/epimerase family protein [Armatimonadota bacterium]